MSELLATNTDLLGRDGLLSVHICAQSQSKVSASSDGLCVPAKRDQKGLSLLSGNCVQLICNK